VINTVCFR